MFTKWDHDYNESMRLSRMEDDGQRFRWWRMVTLSNKMVFPGLLAKNSLQPLKELTLVSEIYTDKEFQDTQKALATWRKEKKIFLDLGVLQSFKTDSLEFLWNNNHHYYQDKGTRQGATLGKRFLEAFEDFQDEKRILYLQLLIAFRPRKITIHDIKNEESINVWEDEWEGAKAVRKSANSIEIHRENEKTKILKIDELCLLYRNRGLDQKTESKPTNPDIRKFIDWWFEEYKKQEHGKKYLVNGKDAKLVQVMLRAFSYDELVELAIKFFGSEDEFIKRAGKTIGVLYSQINSLVSGKDEKEKWEKFKIEK